MYRIGVHSGPVTAGVLRGERARFQLFGDTVNTAARMESHGKKNRIQISKETADLLNAAGKGFWFAPREDKIVAKGKGELQTYWLDLRPGGASLHSSTTERTLEAQGSETGSDTCSSENNLSALKGATQVRLERLISWNVDVLVSMLKQIERARSSANTVPDVEEKLLDLEYQIQSRELSTTTVIDEVVEVVELPQFKAGRNDDDDDEQQPVEISPDVIKQLRNYVSTIAYMYNDNSFHNFEHAR